MAESKSALFLSAWWKSRSSIQNLLTKTHRYDKVFDDDAKIDRNTPSTPTWPFRKALLLMCAITILIVELSFIIFTPNSVSINSFTDELSNQYVFTNSTGYADCGASSESSEVALARGCVFDYLTVNWEPIECYYPDIVDEFYALQDWKYYNDSLGNPISPEVSITDGHPRWNVKWAFHFTHCVYTWKIMRRGILERRPLMDVYLDLDHTRHCMGMMLDRTLINEWEDTSALVTIKWPRCLSFKEWNSANYDGSGKSTVG